MVSWHGLRAAITVSNSSGVRAMDAIANEHYRVGYNPEFYARAQARHKREAAERERQEVRRRAAEAEKAIIAKQREKERKAIEAELRWNTPGRKLAVDIASKVCAEHGIPFAMVIGPSRSNPIVKVRHAAIRAVADARPDLSLPQIARIFGGRCHTTIVHSLRKTRKEGQVR